MPAPARVDLTLRAAARSDLPSVLLLYAQPEIDGGVVGRLALLIMDNLGHLGAPSAIVEDVVVAPTCQRQARQRARVLRITGVSPARLQLRRRRNEHVGVMMAR